MVDVLASKGISIKDEPGSAVVRLFGPGIGNEKVRSVVSMSQTVRAFIYPYEPVSERTSGM